MTLPITTWRGKYDKKNGWYHPVFYHMIDSGNVAHAILDECNDQILDVFCRVIKMPRAKVKKIQPPSSPNKIVNIKPKAPVYTPKKYEQKYLDLKTEE